MYTIRLSNANDYMFRSGLPYVLAAFILLAEARKWDNATVTRPDGTLALTVINGHLFTDPARRCPAIYNHAPII
jgi:hypothetical protein